MTPLAAFCLGLSLLAAPLSAEEISPADLAGRIGAAAPQVLVLGEVHDNAAHHQAQAVAVAALRPKALVFEMLSPEQAAAVTPDLIGRPADLAKLLGWEAAGWPDFSLYAPVFAAAPQARIYGAALPRDLVRKAMTTPLAEVFPQAERFGIATPYPPEMQAALEAETQADHCNALPPEMLPGMVAAQRLRDAGFAQTTLQALADTGGPVALITGSGHARTDRAVPALIAKAAPGVRLVSLGQVESPATAPQPFDWWIVAAPAPREDPCTAFQ